MADIIIIGKKSRKRGEKPHVVYCGDSRAESAQAVKDAAGKFGYMYLVSPYPIAPVKDVSLSEAALKREAAALELERKNNEEAAAAELAKRLADAKKVLIAAQSAANEARTIAEQCKNKGISSSVGNLAQLVKAEEEAAAAVKAVEDEIAEATSVAANTEESPPSGEDPPESAGSDIPESTTEGVSTQEAEKPKASRKPKGK